MPLEVRPDRSELSAKQSNVFTRREVIAFFVSMALSGCRQIEMQKVSRPIQKIIKDTKNTKKPEEIREIPKNAVSIGGKQVEIEDIKKMDAPLTDRQRIMEYPMTDEARKLLEKMRADEGFIKAEDYSIGGSPIMLRKTAAELYKLAQKYAAMEGYGLAIFSAYRDFKKQGMLYRKAGIKSRGAIVAKIKDSQHVRGGAIDVLLYKKEDGKTVTLTPDKAHPDRGTEEDIDRLHKYLQLAGFANYTVEPWHNEIGSEEWAEIMIKEGLFTKKEAEGRLYKPVKKLTKK